MHFNADVCVCCKEKNFITAISILLSDFSRGFSWVESHISGIMLTQKGWMYLNLKQLQDKVFH